MTGGIHPSLACGFGAYRRNASAKSARGAGSQLAACVPPGDADTTMSIEPSWLRRNRSRSPSERRADPTSGSAPLVE